MGWLLAAAVCALAACSSDDDGDARVTTSTIATTTSSDELAFTGERDGPFCSRLREIDPATVLEGAPGDPAVVEAGFQGLVRTLRDLHALAPPEIELDVTLVVEGVEILDAALAAVGYDFDALAASGGAAEVSAAVNDPAFTAAGDRLSRYRTQVCQL